MPGVCRVCAVCVCVVRRLLMNSPTPHPPLAEVPTKEDLKEYNTQEYLTSLNQSRRLAEALGNPTLRYFPSLVIHTFVVHTHDTHDTHDTAHT